MRNPFGFVGKPVLEVDGEVVWMLMRKQSWNPTKGWSDGRRNLWTLPFFPPSPTAQISIHQADSVIPRRPDGQTKPDEKECCMITGGSLLRYRSINNINSWKTIYASKLVFRHVFSWWLLLGFYINLCILLIVGPHLNLASILCSSKSRSTPPTLTHLQTLNLQAQTCKEFNHAVLLKWTARVPHPPPNCDWLDP